MDTKKADRKDVKIPKKYLHIIYETTSVQLSTHGTQPLWHSLKLDNGQGGIDEYESNCMIYRLYTIITFNINYIDKKIVFVQYLPPRLPKSEKGKT